MKEPIDPRCRYCGINRSEARTNQCERRVFAEFEPTPHEWVNEAGELVEIDSEWEICQSCQEAKPDVCERGNGYTVCDDCDHENETDI